MPHNNSNAPSTKTVERQYQEAELRARVREARTFWKQLKDTPYERYAHNRLINHCESLITLRKTSCVNRD
jgi:hypothetical protein